MRCLSFDMCIFVENSGFWMDIRCFMKEAGAEDMANEAHDG